MKPKATKQNIQIKYGLLIFFIFNVIFSLSNSLLGDFYDFQGISGRNPIEHLSVDKAEIEERENKKERKNTPVSLDSTILFHKTDGIKIDGKLNDWDMTASSFIADDFSNAKSNNIWVQGNYDSKFLYISAVVNGMSSTQKNSFEVDFNIQLISDNHYK